MPVIPFLAGGAAAAGAGSAAVGLGAAALGAGASLYAANKQNQASKDAVKAQTNQNASDRQFQVEMANQARNDVTSMYPQMQQNAMLSGQAALTTMNNAFPQQTYARQQGTQNAIAALLGGQGKQIQPNFNFMPKQLPNYQMYQSPSQVVGPTQISPQQAFISQMPAQITAGMDEAQSRDYYGRIAQMLGGK